MNYLHLESFYTVVKCDGFTRAALRTNKAQSAYSAQVATLEKDLGMKLYDIVAKRLRLTPAGQRLYDGIAPFFEGMSDLRRAIQNPDEGRFTIASSQNNTLYRLRTPLQKLRSEFPRVRLRLLVIDSHRAVDVLRAGDADLAVVRMPADLPQDIECIGLPTAPIALVAPVGHPITRKRSVTPADICAFPHVGYYRDDWVRQQCDRVFRTHGCMPDVVLEAGSAEIVKCYVRAGFGLAMLSSLDFMVRSDPELAVIPLERYFGQDLSSVLMPRGRFRPLYVRKLIELLAESPTPSPVHVASRSTRTLHSPRRAAPPAPSVTTKARGTVTVR